MLKPMNHNSSSILFMQSHSIHTQKGINNSYKHSTSKNKEIHQHAYSSLSPSLSQKSLAQASGLSRSGEHPLPRRGLESGIMALSRPLAQTRPPRLSEMGSRSKLALVAWATVCSNSLGELLLISPRRDVLAWARQPEPVTVYASKYIQTDQNMFLTASTQFIMATHHSTHETRPSI